ncbi:sugar phosphate isomerase/epimerase family protein [Pedococcus sp. 5OH_020]|uniref:sugar phosphate isomerase/epimerase family protein n=1 Tax=Pedococcus sp. 5OH_020 TaxID=2989814 RepID=UPI0022E9A779|nr:sugar phosphate isomerase/epimerase [Pedococcus sp. 5OH_020]
MALRTGSSVALNLLPWALQADGTFAFSLADLPGALRQARAAGFEAVMADVPEHLSSAAYLLLLHDHGVRPAPGYFSVDCSPDASVAPLVERAARHAGQQAELGLSESFVAAAMSPERLRRPAVGAAFDLGRLGAVVDQLGRVAEVMAGEGVRACLHPHVGSWVETEHETRAVLDGIAPGLLAFGPDTGHLFWAGMDPAAMVSDYAERVAAVHLKDVHSAAARRARTAGSDYVSATVRDRLWTEPGRGDVPIVRFLEALPPDFTGWHIVEVDVPDGGTPLESARRSAAWVCGQVLGQDRLASRSPGHT